MLKCPKFWSSGSMLSWCRFSTYKCFISLTHSPNVFLSLGWVLDGRTHRLCENNAPLRLHRSLPLSQDCWCECYSVKHICPAVLNSSLLAIKLSRNASMPQACTRPISTIRGLSRGLGTTTSTGQKPQYLFVWRLWKFDQNARRATHNLKRETTIRRRGQNLKFTSFWQNNTILEEMDYHLSISPLSEKHSRLPCNSLFNRLMNSLSSIVSTCIFHSFSFWIFTDHSIATWSIQNNHHSCALSRNRYAMHHWRAVCWRKRVFYMSLLYLVD